MSRLKKLFFGRASTPNLKAQSYETTVQRDLPVKGSYPVAGNGPNVLEEIQRSRAKRDTRRQSVAAATPLPNVPRSRDDVIERPRTAPNDGSKGAFGSGRTRSGFSMKSPPSFLSSSRRNSLRKTTEPPPVPTPPAQIPTPKPPSIIQTYQPRKGAEEEQYGNGNGVGFVPPFARHNRTDSHASHRSHVDLLEAHSNIRPSREASRHRAKASGVRNYGEDVADRNMNPKDREPRLDLNSPEFSYLKTVYSPKKRPGLDIDGGHSRTSSALGHVLGQDSPSDDIQSHTRHTKAASIRSIRSTATAPRPDVPHPLRNDSPSAYSYSTNGGRDDDLSTRGDLATGRRARALSPLSTSSIQDDSVPENIRQADPLPDRGRATLRQPAPIISAPKQPKAYKQTASTPSIAPVPEHHSAATPRILKEPPPVAPPGELPRAIPQPTERRASTSSAKKPKQRTMSSASQTSTGTSNGHTSRGSYSAFPHISLSDRSSTKSPISPVNKRAGMLIEERSEPISLEGIVDLNNTVDTDVSTKTLPAVTHEHVTPTRHEIREERITREIHTHDVFHRILPVIETEVLPTKHYVPSEDGKGLTEISLEDLHKYTKHTVTGKPNDNWQVVKGARSRAGSRTASLSQSIYSHTNDDEDDGADGPVIGLARGDPRPTSRTSSFRSRNILEPTLSSMKEYMTKDGYSKTEYVWRHPPVFEDAQGRTQPVYIGAGLGDLSSPIEDDSDEDSAGAAFGAAKGEEDLLFSNSGYGSAGMLPGLGQRAPVANSPRTNGGFEDRIKLGKVLNHKDEMTRSEGEATKALRRINERRGSRANATSKGKGRAADTRDLENAVNGLTIR